MKITAEMLKDDCEIRQEKLDQVATELVDEFYSMAPQYRTKKRLATMIASRLKALDILKS